MKDNSILPDDPKLTAYALGELTGDERAAVEAALRQNPALRIAVDDIRATAAHLEAALAGEPVAAPSSPAFARGIVVQLNAQATDASKFRSAPPKAARTNGRHVSPEVKNGYDLPHSRQKLVRFPEFYYVVATAAAACFAVVVALRDTPPPRGSPVERTVRHHVVLSPSSPTRENPSDAVSASAEPVESHIAAVTLPPIVAVAPTEASAGNEPAHPASSPNDGTAFVDGGLSLISHAKADRDSSNFQLPASGTEEPRLRFTGETPVPLQFRRDHGIDPLKSLNHTERAAAVTRSEPAAPAGEARPGLISPRVAPIEPSTTPAPTRPLFSEALAPQVAGPVVAGTTLPSVLPNQGSTARGASGPAVVPGSDDVVMLSPFTVTAERATGFATTGHGGIPSDKRGAPGRDDRPHAPPGAKFGRNTEAYSYIRDNDFLPVAQNRLSTFSVDVDTASYANIRRFIEHGALPPRDAVRIEEMLNYFPYRYANPKGDVPFAAVLEVAEAPWAPAHRLVRIGLKAREVSAAERPAASLVFLLDVSASMNQPNKLPLVKQSLRLLVGKLRVDDRVAIVTYAGNSGLALPSTLVGERREIMNALDALTPNGAANGAMGIQLAYEIAKANFVPNGINRVILCTDGDFNVGATSEGELARLVEEKAASGVFLTVLGFGMGNYKDATLEKLADKGNGNYGYIDTRREAEKLLVQQVNSTLVTVAKDVKVQIEFNPATVSSYRLIGYENRLLRKEDFNNDSVDAGEVGAGQTVTALYEIIPVGAEDRGGREAPLDDLRYSAREPAAARLDPASGKRDPFNNELLVVKVRYKKPKSFFSFFNFSKRLEFPLLNTNKEFDQSSADFRFAAAVAQYGMMLRGSPYRGTANMEDVAAWATTAAAPVDDPDGFRAEFIELVRKTQAMTE